MDTPPPYLTDKHAIPMLDKAIGDLAILSGYMHGRHTVQGRLGKCLDELIRVREELVKS